LPACLPWQKAKAKIKMEIKNEKTKAGEHTEVAPSWLHGIIMATKSHQSIIVSLVLLDMVRVLPKNSEKSVLLLFLSPKCRK
jgi:hypothetical protein